MKPNYTTYQLLIFVLGILGAFFLLVYQNAATVMYPNGANSFSTLFYGAAGVLTIIGLLLPIKSLKRTLVTIGLSFLLLLSIATIVSGHVYSYNIKTDEFIIYFALTSLTALTYVLVVVIIGTLVFLRSGLDQKKIFQLMLTILVGFLVGYTVKLLAIEAISVWYGIVALLTVVFYLVRRDHENDFS